METAWIHMMGEGALAGGHDKDKTAREQYSQAKTFIVTWKRHKPSYNSSNPTTTVSVNSSQGNRNILRHFKEEDFNIGNLLQRYWKGWRYKQGKVRIPKD